MPDNAEALNSARPERLIMSMYVYLSMYVCRPDVMERLQKEWAENPKKARAPKGR